MVAGKAHDPGGIECMLEERVREFFFQSGFDTVEGVQLHCGIVVLSGVVSHRWVCE